MIVWIMQNDYMNQEIQVQKGQMMTSKVYLRVPKTLVDGTRKYGSNWTQLEKDKHTKVTSDDTWYYYTADREFIEDTGLGGVFAYLYNGKDKE